MNDFLKRVRASLDVDCSDRQESKLRKEEAIMLSRSVNYRRMLGYVLVVLIGCAPLWCGTPRSLWAGEVLQSAPVNPEFVKYFQDKAAGKLQTVTEEGYPLGHIPPPILLPSLKKKVLTSAPIVGELPATFDLRTVNGLTAVRDQRNCGSCWAFASLGSLESYLKYKASQTWNFSEQDLNQYHGFTPRECEGGNFLMSTAYLARWSGPVSEADMPYPYAAPGVPIKKHVQRVWFLPNRTSYTDNDMIKTAVQNYGAVYMSFEWNLAYYNATTKAYYTTLTGGNHAVAIVGWDDNYPKTNFNVSTQPTGNGAFLVRNSWGTGWGESGYFYISYYDNSLQASAAFYNAEPITNYSQAYEYDPLGLVNLLGYDSGNQNVAYFANMFKVRSTAKVLKAVSFYTPVPNSKYTVYIYDKAGVGKPKSGALKKTVTGTLARAGYNTVQFAVPVTLTPYARFSVIVKLTTPNFIYPIPVEERLTGYSDAANAYIGQSFVSQDNVTWTDLTDAWNGYANVCLKAFGSSQ